MNAQESSRPLIVLIPVFNDWPAVSQLLRHLLRRRIGKSIVGIWRKAEDNTEELGRV